VISSFKLDGNLIKEDETVVSLKTGSI